MTSTSANSAHVAIDLGAESGRVIVGALEDGRLRMEETHRFAHAARTTERGLRWDVEALWDGIVDGLRAAGRWSRANRIPLASAGVDTWGVDFALLDEHDSLLAAPRCYRDASHFAAMDVVLATHDRRRLYRTSGCAAMFFNTLFQLVAMRDAEPELLHRARSLLFMPDYFHWRLSGAKRCESTIASTSGAIDATTGAWATRLLDELRVPTHMLLPTIAPGRRVGTIRGDLARELELDADLAIVAPAGHDTASAVAAVPAVAGSRWAYLSSGTWSLIGVERTAPLLTDDACDAKLTNEGGARGTTRLLRNIVGLWMIQEYRRELERAGDAHSYEELAALAERSPSMRTLIDVADERLHPPGDMRSRIAALAEESGEPVPADVGATVRASIESLALEYARTLAGIERIVGACVDVLHVVGGGSLNELLNQCTADAIGRTVVAGPVEATAAGNLLLQAVGVGSIAPDDVRSIVRASFPLRTYEPSAARRAEWRRARERYERLPSRSRPRVTA
ncbi:MAG: rhamnulokinase family protein [Phycisphaerales bacterium]